MPHWLYLLAIAEGCLAVLLILVGIADVVEEESAGDGKPRSSPSSSGSSYSGSYSPPSSSSSSTSNSSFNFGKKSWSEERAQERRDWQNTVIGRGQFGP
jgi:hypothetical protein